MVSARQRAPVDVYQQKYLCHPAHIALPWQL
jgi:hypothetical protein